MPPGRQTRYPGPRYFRKVIRITAEDSPNVRLGLMQRQAGQEPTAELVLPGVLPWTDYLYRMAHWDDVKKCVGLGGSFYQGGEELLFPPDVLDRSERVARSVAARKRKGEAVGVDTAEGGDDTSFCVCDSLGVLEMASFKTPNTSVVRRHLVALGRKWGVPAERWALDQGGGGRWAADELRELGYSVRTVGFGASVAGEVRGGRKPTSERRDEREAKYAYVNRRAQLYGEASVLMASDRGFGLPAELHELRRQLSKMPKIYDVEGRLRMLPKRARPGSNEPCLERLIGRSPDDADAFVLAVHVLLHSRGGVAAGAAE